MKLLSEKVWVIMNKERTVIAKGVPRNRCLCLIEDKMRILTYKSKKMAESAFKNNWFYNDKVLGEGTQKEKRDMLEAVEVEMSLTEI